MLSFYHQGVVEEYIWAFVNIIDEIVEVTFSLIWVRDKAAAIKLQQYFTAVRPKNQFKMIQDFDA